MDFLGILLVTWNRVKLVSAQQIQTKLHSVPEVFSKIYDSFCTQEKRNPNYFHYYAQDAEALI